MKGKWFSLISLLLVVILLISACGPTPAPVIQTVEVEKVVTKEVPKEVLVTQEVIKEVETLVTVEVPQISEAEKLTGVVRMGSWDSGDALEPFNNAIQSFKAKYPNVEIQLEAVPQDYGTKLLAQIAANTAPDVFQIGDGDVGKYVKQGVVASLDESLAADPSFSMDAFFPGIAAFGQVAGKTYFFTKDYSPLVLYYNRDHFKEAGLDFPTEEWTWDDLLAAAQKLTLDANGNDATSAGFDPTHIARWGIQLPDSWGDPLWLRGILPIIWQGGGDTISPDGTTTTGYLNGPETVAALQWYVDLFKKHYVAPTRDDVQAMAGVDMFQSGLASMLWTGRWPLKDFLKNPNLSFGTTMLPAGPAGRANALCWAGFAIYEKSQNKEAAWAWLKYIGAQEGAQEFAKYAFTAVQPIAELQGLSTDPYNAPIVKDLDNVRSLPEFRNPKYGECVEKYFKEELEKVFLQDKDIATAMNDAAAAADTCLAEP